MAAVTDEADVLDLNGLSVVLGTSSKWRRALFASRFPDLSFSVEAADIDESAITADCDDRGSADPSRLTLALAHAKARAILPRLSGDLLLITSDQVLAFKGRIREKPSSEDECREYLRSYRDEPAVTVTALVVTNVAANGAQVSQVDIAKQHFKAIPENIIDALIAKGDVMHSAGGFTVEDPLLAPFLGYRQGTEDSIMGLPVSPLRKLLQDAAGLPRNQARKDREVAK